MMETKSITVKISVAWWLRPYLALLTIACQLSGREPDWAKLTKTMDRALRMSSKGRPC